MRFKRTSGTLVHPTSFPAPYGMGDFGRAAYTFIDFLKSTNQGIWQVLPLGPTGYGNSPYTSYSAFAGNPYLVSPELLREKGLLTEKEIREAKLPLSTEAEYERAFSVKDKLFEKAAERFYKDGSVSEKKALNQFKQENTYWIDDFVLFMTCLEEFGEKPWNKWDPEISHRNAKALKKIRKDHKQRIDYHYWIQFEFFNQWYKLREYANKQDIRVVGDIPIFVDHNSVDVWAHRQYFEVNEKGNRKLVAGVPPDYFSKTGQLWGNPLYNWDKLQEDDFSWWVHRFEQMFAMYDSIRVDHFRGFDAYWEVDAHAKTAEHGEWVKAPGEELFKTIKDKLGEIPIIAEDLGVMTPGVEQLRDAFNFPGMKILHFAFNSDAANSYLPHNYHPNCVVYTGTHDNDTTLGWYQSATEQERDKARHYTRSDGSQINWELIRMAMLSVADQAIFPLQDFMNLGTEHRMNTPGVASGNWKWRYIPEMLENIDQHHIRYLIELSNR